MRNGRLVLAGGENKQWIARSIFVLEKAAGGALKVTHLKASFGREQGAFLLHREFVSDPATGVLELVSFTRPDIPEGRHPVATTTKGVARPGKAPEAVPPAPLPLRPGLVMLPVGDETGAVRPQAGERPQGIIPKRPVPVGDTGSGEPSPGDTPRTVEDAAGHGGCPGGALRGHAALDAKVLAAVRARGGAADKSALAEATGYAPKTVANALARLRKTQVLPRPKGSAAGNVVRAESRSSASGERGAG
jgi:hypothetical protein